MKISNLNINDFIYDEKTLIYKRKEGNYWRFYKKIICIKCKEFALIRKDSISKYCSKYCSQIDNNRVYMTGEKAPGWKGGVSKSKCIDCGKEIKGKSKRCKSCGLKFYIKDNSPGWKGGVSKSKCIDCGKEIKGKSKRCRTCFDKQNYGKNNSMYGRNKEETNGWNKNIKQRFCEVCGKPFHRHDKKSKVCIKCYEGKYTPAYIDGRSKNYCGLYQYSKDFRTPLKNIVKNRDKYKCQYPECKNESNYLCIHHIDYNKKNSNIDNLITLCLSCHIKTNHNRKYHKIILEGIINERKKIR
jgi:hypothetical protein